MGRSIRGALAALVMAGALLAVPSSVAASDDAAGLVVSHDRRFIDEGSSKTFTVKLASRPIADDPGTDVVVSDDVSVQLWSHHETVATISAAGVTPDADGNLFLTFTSSNWNTAQTVTVTAVSDDDRVDEMTDIEFSTGSADADYFGLTHTVAVVALETQRDPGTPTSVTAERQWHQSTSSYAVYLRWSGNNPGNNWIYRRNISLGETGFTHIPHNPGRDFVPLLSNGYDTTVQTGINLYRVGRSGGHETSRTVAVYFYPAGGA